MDCVFACAFEVLNFCLQFCSYQWVDKSWPSFCFPADGAIVQDFVLLMLVTPPRVMVVGCFWNCCISCVRCPCCVWVALILGHHHHDRGIWCGGKSGLWTCNTASSWLMACWCCYAFGCSYAVSVGFCCNVGGETGASFSGTEADFALLTFHQARVLRQQPNATNCYLVSVGCSRCRNASGHHPLPSPHPAVSTHSDIPIFKCTNACISYSCLCVEQRNLCWIILVQLVKFKGRYKERSS